MRPTTLFFYFSCFIICLSGCGESSTNYSPVIGDIYTDISHQHPSFFGKWGDEPNISLRFRVSAQVSDPQGFDNLAEVYFYNSATNKAWDFVGNGTSLDECFLDHYQVFECLFYSSETLDSVNLNSWFLVAVDRHGNRTEKPFKFALPGGDSVVDQTFVYSNVYEGDIKNGIPALDTLVMLDNEIRFSSDPDTESFRIAFNVIDKRANSYSFSFYDGTNEINLIGRTCVCSPSIESTPIVIGQLTIVNIPWSEIDFSDGTSAEDVRGLHIKLYDEPVDWILRGEYAGTWFNYVSYSEYITL